MEDSHHEVPKKIRNIATSVLASAMIITLGGCFYGGHGDRGGQRRYDRGNNRDYQLGGGRHDEGMRSAPSVNRLTGTATAATINAPVKVAIRHPSDQ